MGMLVVLFEKSRSEPVLDETTLARVGITTASVLRDETTVGVVLEGWAFDPTRSTDDALTAVTGAERNVRVLLAAPPTLSGAGQKGG